MNLAIEAAPMCRRLGSAGAMYNTSKFPNYQAFLANPTVIGTPAGKPALAPYFPG
jgi:hypothetical protein